MAEVEQNARPAPRTTIGPTARSTARGASAVSRCATGGRPTPATTGARVADDATGGGASSPSRTGHLAKRSVTLSGHRTSIALEPSFLHALDRLAAARGQSFAALVASVDRTRDPATPLASALRVLALDSALTTAADAHSMGT